MTRSTRAMTALALALGIAIGLGASPAEEKVEIKVRHLKGAPPGNEKQAIQVFTSKNELEKGVGAKLAKTLEGQVDFDKEQIVWVKWTTDGPPDGTLQHEIKGEDNKEVVFFVKAPAAKVRGERMGIRSDCFAVPAKVKVSFDKVER